MIPIGFGLAAAIGLIEAQAEARLRQRLTPQQFREWQAEKTAERRHQELVRAIRDAGESAGRSNCSVGHDRWIARWRGGLP